MIWTFRFGVHHEISGILHSIQEKYHGPWWFTHSCSLWPKFRKSLGSSPNQRRLSRIWRTGNGTCRTTVHPKMAQLKRMLRRLKNEAKVRERGSKLPVGDINKKDEWRGLGKGWKGKGYVSLIWISKWHLISLSFYSVFESTAGNPKHNSPLGFTQDHCGHALRGGSSWHFWSMFK